MNNFIYKNNSKIGILLASTSLSVYYIKSKFCANKPVEYTDNSYSKKNDVLNNNNNNMLNPSITTIKNLCKKISYAILSERTSTLKCNSDPNSRYGSNDVLNIENELNNNVEDNNLPDVPFDMMNDEDIAELMQNPDLDPESYQEIMTGSMGITPPPFKGFSQAFKLHNDDEYFNGLKLSAVYSPIQTLKLEGETVFDIKTRSKNMKMSLLNIISSKVNPNKNIVVVGRTDSSSANMLQMHLSLSEKDRISLVSQYKSNDTNQFGYELEYTKVFDRMQSCIKYSTMGTSLGLVTNVWKNLHVGVESVVNPKTGELVYSYGINHKPFRKLGYSIVYLSYMPMFSFDLMFMVIYLILLNIFYILAK